MDARERFTTALAERVNTMLYAEGVVFLATREIERIAEETGAADHEARAVLGLVDQEGLLERQEGGWDYSDGEGLALRYEQADRKLFWEHNALRRRVLALAAEAYERGEDELVYREDAEKFIDTPWAETFAASKTLAYLGLLDVRPFMGHNFHAQITPAGYELQRDHRALQRELPTSGAEDEEGAEAVTSDALRELITSVENLLTKREWAGAARELRRGDDQYRNGDWTDAVREYYAALESALKHRLDEAGVDYGEGAALNRLARIAADQNLIPVNYQALFGFVDSIRSPRSHGTGGEVEEVEVGQAEALLMGNHVRALMLYLGHRPG